MFPLRFSTHRGHSFSAHPRAALYGSTFRTHWVNYTDLSPESADLPRQCMPPEKPVLSIQMLEDRYALENYLLDAVHHGDAELAMQALQSFHGVTCSGIIITRSHRRHRR